MNYLKLKLDQYGLLCLLVFIIAHSFHFMLHDSVFLYYREFFFTLFTFLFTANFYVIIKLQSSIYSIFRVEIILYLFFIFFIILSSFFDPGIKLYEVTSLDDELRSSDYSEFLYILRNSILYFPMVVYLSSRGLNEIDIKKISIVIFILSPLNIIQYLRNNVGIDNLNAFNSTVSTSTFNLEYNSFVPSLTFPIICSFYLLFNENLIVKKVILFLLSSLVLFYVLISTSRQSFLFAFISLLFFTNRNGKYNFTYISLLFLFSMSVLIELLMGVNSISDKLLDRYSSVHGFLDTERWYIVSDGILMLKIREFFTGAGLTSVIFAGPHNDFVRWLQRIGVVGMFMGFLPFFIAAKRQYLTLKESKKPVNILLFMGVIFTIFHSFFGYPREDAYQAFYCFLGLGMYLGADSYRVMDIDHFKFKSRNCYGSLG